MKPSGHIKLFWAFGFVAAAAALVAAQGSVYYFPHVANGEIGSYRYCNTLYILNLNYESQSADITLEFFRDDGSPWVIDLYGDNFNGSNSSFTRSLGDGHTAYSATNPHNQALETGWLRITASRPIWVTSTFVFMDWDWNPIWEAGVLPAAASQYFSLQSPIASRAIVGDNLDTALAFANPGSIEAQVEVRMFRFGEWTSQFVYVPPSGHFAQFMSELFEHYDDLDGESIHLEIFSNVPVAVVGLLSRADKSIFASIPLEPTNTLAYHRLSDIYGNESSASPRHLVPPVEITGHLFANNEYYSVDLTAGKIVNILVVSSQLGTDLDSRLTLYDKNGAQVAYNDDMSAGCKDSFISYAVPSSGRYTIRVSYGPGGGFGPFDPYRLIVSIR